MKEDYKNTFAYEEAKKRVKVLKGFYWNLFSFIVVTFFLMCINYLTYWGYQWFWFPTCSWAVGLFIHGIIVFSDGRIFLSKNWEDKKVKEFIDKELNEEDNFKYE